MSAKIVIDSVRERHLMAIDIFERYIHYLALGIITIINAFDPEVIVLGGGVSAAGDFLLEPLRRHVKEHIFYKDLPHATVELSPLGNDAGIIGAGCLARLRARVIRHEAKSPRNPGGLFFLITGKAKPLFGVYRVEGRLAQRSTDHTLLASSGDEASSSGKLRKFA